LAEQFEAAFEVRVRASAGVTALDDPVRNQLSEPVRLAVYRIVEEGLSNATRHAHATHVRVRLSTEWLGYQGYHLTLEVQDDGIGFDSTISPPHLGLLCLQDRVEELGGGWHIAARK